MGINARIVFRSNQSIEQESLDRTARALYRSFGRESFHYHPGLFQLLTPLRNKDALERQTHVKFGPDDHLYFLYHTMRHHPSDDRANFHDQTDWMSFVLLAHPSIEVVYYGSDSINHPYRVILPRDIPHLRQEYLNPWVGRALERDDIDSKPELETP